MIYIRAELLLLLVHVAILGRLEPTRPTEKKEVGAHRVGCTGAWSAPLIIAYQYIQWRIQGCSATQARPFLTKQ